MRHFLLLCLFVLGTFVGCNQPVSAPTANNASEDPHPQAAASETSLEPSLANGSDQIAANPTHDNPKEAFDYGDWLSLPQGINSSLASVYPTLVQATISEDASGQANLAVVSQQIASEVAQGGDVDQAYKFILQSGQALRKAIANGATGLPDSFVAQIYFNEACALARSGSIEHANAALNDAFDSGFSNTDAIESEEDLAAVRESEGFEERLSQWKQAAIEKIKEQAREDLVNGESFPFALSATDISGTEHNLEEMKGKVVIVDVWGTWCPPCRAEIPSFIKLQNEFGDQGFQMIGLNYERLSSAEENLKAVIDYANQEGINYPCIMGDDQTRAQIPDFRGFPTTLFIDKTSQVRMKAVGLHDYQYLAAVVSQLLAE